MASTPSTPGRTLPEYWIIGQNRDTGVRFRVDVVHTLAEAEAITADHAKRFPADQYWFTRQITIKAKAE